MGAALPRERGWGQAQGRETGLSHTMAAQPGAREPPPPRPEKEPLAARAPPAESGRNLS